METGADEEELLAEESKKMEIEKEEEERKRLLADEGMLASVSAEESLGKRAKKTRHHDVDDPFEAARRQALLEAKEAEKFAVRPTRKEPPPVPRDTTTSPPFFTVPKAAVGLTGDGGVLIEQDDDVLMFGREEVWNLKVPQARDDDNESGDSVGREVWNLKDPKEYDYGNKSSDSNASEGNKNGSSKSTNSADDDSMDDKSELKDDDSEFYSLPSIQSLSPINGNPSATPNHMPHADSTTHLPAHVAD